MTASSDDRPRPRPPYSFGIGMAEHAEVGAPPPGVEVERLGRVGRDDVVIQGLPGECNRRVLERCDVV